MMEAILNRARGLVSNRRPGLAEWLQELADALPAYATFSLPSRDIFDPFWELSFVSGMTVDHAIQSSILNQ